VYDIPLIKPRITDAARQRVMDVLDSGYLTEGPVTREFETRVGEYCGARHCIAVTSCTTGLELALRALDVGPGDEVIVPDYTYPATASAVAVAGATPVIVDVNPRTMLIDYDALEKAVTERTRAVIPVSLFGNPPDWKKLDAIKTRHGLFMIEDAACSLGAEWQDARVGTQADITVFSLHPRKFITTGEGGLVCTQSDEWAEWMQSFKHFGMASDTGRKDVKFVRIGSNHKLSNVLAAIGLAQMDEIDTMLARRQELAARYDDMLADANGVEPQLATPGATHSYQSYCVRVADRDRILHSLREAGIEVQIGTYALHMHEAFSGCPAMPGSRKAFETTLALPLFHEMTQSDQERVVKELREVL